MSEIQILFSLSNPVAPKVFSISVKRHFQLLRPRALLFHYTSPRKCILTRTSCFPTTLPCSPNHHHLSSGFWPDALSFPSFFIQHSTLHSAVKTCYSDSQEPTRCVPHTLLGVCLLLQLLCPLPPPLQTQPPPSVNSPTAPTSGPLLWTLFCLDGSFPKCLHNVPLLFFQDKI